MDSTDDLRCKSFYIYTWTKDHNLAQPLLYFLDE